MFSPEKVNLKIKSADSKEGVFILSPLPKGFANTLGNSLRRVLLSSVLGTAVTKMYIDGANHEFATLKGIKEDVFLITQNIKKINFAINSEGFDELKVSISKKGLGDVKASDLVLPSNVKVINPTQVICTITEAKTTFEADLYIKNGYGFVLAEDNRKENDKVGYIYLDSSFSPVSFVNYTVETARLGRQTDLDELVLTVRTNGAIKPEDAFKFSNALLRDFFSKLAEGELISFEESEESPKVEEVSDTKNQKAREVPIEELNLATRTINALKKHGVKSLDDLSQMDEDRLLSVRNLGEKSISEIKKLLKKEGLS